jgi:hypothetical protein
LLQPCASSPNSQAFLTLLNLTAYVWPRRLEQVGREEERRAEERIVGIEIEEQ